MSRFLVFAAMILACLAFGRSQSAWAAEHALGRPCALATATDENVEKLFTSVGRFECGDGSAKIYGPYTWGLFHGLNVDVDPQKPLQLRHSPHQFQSQTAYARLADGRIVELPRSGIGLVSHLSSEVISHDLPALGSPVAAILVMEEGMQHQRGILTDSSIVSAADGAREDSGLILFYASMAGVVFALLLFNGALFFTLRYPFLLANCVTNLVILWLGISWAGDLLPFVPSIKLADQLSIIQLTIAIYILLTGWFMLTFIERDQLGAKAHLLVLLPALASCGAAAMRLVDLTFQWEMVDFIFYLGMALAMMVKFPLAAAAVWRGSRAARVYLALLAIPMLMAAARLYWGQDLREGGGTLVAISPAWLMVLGALLNSLAISWKIGQLRDERNDAVELANVDPMTGLLNRRAFEAEVCQGPAAKQLLLLDIDRFKSINDCFGHQTGDLVIVHLAQLLRTHSPPSAILGRLGGEEFAVCVRADVAPALGDVIRRTIVASPFPNGLMVSVSVGVTMASIKDGTSWSQAYAAADKALYEAKNGGRNRVVATGVRSEAA